MKKDWPKILKENVFISRKEGMSYGALSLKYKVAKSTLHYWLSKVDFSKNNAIKSRGEWIKISNQWVL